MAGVAVTLDLAALGHYRFCQAEAEVPTWRTDGFDDPEMTMSHGHDRHTPYEAQLNHFLGRRPQAPFSSRTLAERFENGRRDETSALRGIEVELRQAFADGRLVQYRNVDGEPLTESRAKNISSQRLSRPALYGLPDAPLPAAAAGVLTYEQTLRGTGDADSVTPSGEPQPTAELEPTAGADTAAADADVEGNGDLAEAGAAAERELISDDEVEDRLKCYPPAGSTAPQWAEEPVLRVWVSLPEVCRRVLNGLDTAHGQDKFELLRAGVSRKQRGGWRSESTIAGNLAALCHKSPLLWSNVAGTALGHYLKAPDGVPLGDLAQLEAEPLEYYDNSEQSPEAILLLAMALGADEGALEMIAADCAISLGERKVTDQATAQQERIQALEAEAEELRRMAKEADKERRAALKCQRAVKEENERLRAAQTEAGEVADAERDTIEQELRRRAEDAEAQLEDTRAEADRVPELEAQIEGLEGVREQLDEAQAAVLQERRMRTQAERDATRHIERVRELTNELTQVADGRNLPIENAAALVDALTRPIGHAARHATERLAAGRTHAHDDLLLELSTTVAQIARKLDADELLRPADGAAPGTVAEPTGDAVEPATPEPANAAEPEPQTVEPEPVAEAESAATVSGPEPQVAAAGRLEPGASFGRRRRRSRIKVQPLGGAGEVGGSALLVTNSSGHTVLLDCGQRVRGEYGLDTAPQFHRRVGQEGRLHAILLSHAHIDHVGSLPVLHREQSEAQDDPIPVHMTAPTRRLAQFMLEDSAKIQQHRETERAEYGFLDYGAGTMEAAYRIADVKRVLDDEFVREAEPARVVQIPGTTFVVRFLPVAHVLGSCAIHLTDTENDQTLLYTGDLGPFNDPQVTLPHYTMSEMLAANLVIMESTYGVPPKDAAEAEGRRLRRSLSGREQAVKRMCDVAAESAEQGGCLLLPSFSLGRTQELALAIAQARADGDAPAGEILVAGMGEKITEQVYTPYSKGANAWARAENMPRIEQLGNRLRKNPDLRFEEVVHEVLQGGFSYIIASPAMLGSGWSRTFLQEMVDNPAHAVVMTGYIPRHAGGIPRLHMLKRGDTIDIGGRRARIECQFLRLQGLSAHASSVDLRQFARYMARQGDGVAFAMVHGEEAAQQALAEDVTQIEGATAEALYNDQVWQPTRP